MTASYKEANFSASSYIEVSSAFIWPVKAINLHKY